MRVSLAILLSLAVLAALFLPALEAAAMRRRGGRRVAAGRSRGRAAAPRHSFADKSLLFHIYHS